MPYHHWKCPPELWVRLRPLAQEMRCKPTVAEERLWQQLRNRQIAGCKFRRQHAIERFIVDFYSAEARIVIEVDGDIHLQTQENDATRQNVLESFGVAVIRFTNDEVLNGMEEVLKKITEVVITRT